MFIENNHLVEIREHVQMFVETYNDTQEEMTDELTTWCSIIAMVNDYLEVGSIEFVIDKTGTPRVACFGVDAIRAAQLLWQGLDILEEDTFVN